MSNIFETQYIRSMKHRNFLFIRFANRDITYFIYRNTFDIMAYAIYSILYCIHPVTFDKKQGKMNCNVLFCIKDNNTIFYIQFVLLAYEI